MLKIENTEVIGLKAAIRGIRDPMSPLEKSDSFCKPSTENCCGCHNYNKCAYIFELTGKPYQGTVGPKDLDLMTRLRNAGKDHRKFMRMIAVYLDITAPLYWWKEFDTYFDTYKVSTVVNPCSTMNNIADKEFTVEDFSYEHLLNMANNDAGDALFLNDTNNIRVDSDNLLGLTINVLNYYRGRYIKTKDKRYWWQLIQLLPISYNQLRTVMLNYEVLANIYNSIQNYKLDEWHTFCDWVDGLPYSELIKGKG